MNELKEWIITIVIAGVIWYAFEGCENKSKEEKKEEPVYLQWEPTPASQNSYTSSQSTSYTSPSTSYNDDWEPEIVEEEEESKDYYTYTYTSTTSFNTSNSNEEEDKYDNYEETSSCLDGEIVYEGDDDYYIVETRSGYTILERRSGGSLYEGDRIRGELHNYGTTYIIKKNTDREVRVYIEEYMLSDDRAIEWMGDHDHLDSSDQDVYDAQND